MIKPAPNSGLSRTGRRLRPSQRFASVGAVVLAAGAVQVAAMSAAHAAGTTFSATGAAQSYTVPAGVTQVSVDALGGQGGGASGGNGGESVTLLSVTPGDVLEVVVGGSGNNGGFNGGGAAGAQNNGANPGNIGGGASDVRAGSCAATLSCGLSDRVVVGAGGGAAGGDQGFGTPNGGIGGGAVGGDGTAVCGQGAGNGYGATQTSGGGTSSGTNSSGTPGGAGIGGDGGPGGGPGGGGGGGGYFGGGGGGGGAAFCDGGGGGGSSFGPAGATLNSGVQSGDGQVTITPAGPVAQTITFTSTAPTHALPGDTYTITATGGGSGNPVVFFTDPTSKGCTVTPDGQVGFTAVGNCRIDASQAGAPGYTAAPTVQQKIIVHQIPQTITFTSTPPAHAVAGTPYTATATGGASGNPVVFSAGTTPASYCTVASDGTVTFTGPGRCGIVATQAGNATYSKAPAVKQFVLVNRK